MPASENHLCLFVSSLANQNLYHSTIKCYLAAVRHLHIAEGYGDPNISSMPRLEQVLKGVKSVQARGLQRIPRLPITPNHLVNMKEVWDKLPNTFDGKMLWAASSCFFGFLWSGEITIPSDSSFDKGAHLNYEDIAVDRLHCPQVLKFRIRASKTDPFRVGVDIFVGKTANQLCPVTAILSYMVARGPGDGPFFRFDHGRPLTRPRFVARIKEALTTAGFDCTAYSGHSFRSGAATTAAAQRFSEATIKMLGRWKSNAYQLYIKTPRDQLASYSYRLGCALSPTQ